MTAIACLTVFLLSVTPFENKLINWLKAPRQDNYSCVNDSLHGSLYYPGDRSGMEHFYNCLDSMLVDGCNVNILHIGGSHVQAGDFSGQMRSNFSRLGESTVSDRGMIFPFKVLKSNGPWNYYVQYTGEWGRSRCVSETPDVSLGLSGAAAIAKDPNDSVSFDFRGDTRWAFNRLRIIGEPSSPEAYPIIITDSDTLCSVARDEAHESYIFDLGEERTTFQLAFRGLDSAQFVLRGIMPTNDREGIVYTESGVNGASVPSWLRCSKFQQDLSLLPPDLVIFGIGINDANVPEKDFNPDEFKANYRMLICRIREVSPDCSFLFITNNDCYLSLRRKRKRFNPNTVRAREAFIDLAKEYNGCVFDVYSLMGGFKSSDKWLKAKLMKRDHIHFTREGYQLLGDILYNSIIDDYFVQREKK